MNWFDGSEDGGRLWPSDSVDLAQITPQLYVGARPWADDWKRFQELGITVFVSLQAEREPAAPWRAAEGYLWLPTVDGDSPSLAQLELGVAFIDQAIRAGRKVFVHCFAGVGRSPLLCAAYLVTQGLHPEEAIEKVEEARPVMDLNPRQRLRLYEFAQRWAEGK